MKRKENFYFLTSNSWNKNSLPKLSDKYIFSRITLAGEISGSIALKKESLVFMVFTCLHWKRFGQESTDTASSLLNLASASAWDAAKFTQFPELDLFALSTNAN
jgi:hypothetical protein